MNKPAFVDFLKMPAEQQASHADHFAALNETPVLQAERRWKAARWVPCKFCDGQGYGEYDTGNPNTYREHSECNECGGTGGRDMSYLDWCDTLEDNDPALDVWPAGAS